MGTKCLIKKFQNKRWSVASMNHLTKKIDNCGSTEWKSGSGRPMSLRTVDNVSMIQCFIYDKIKFNQHKTTIISDAT